MSIPNHARANFETLLRAARDGDLALMECADTNTGQPRYVLCGVGRNGADCLFTPFGHLADDNPYDAYLRRIPTTRLASCRTASQEIRHDRHP
jgi:hypothetical protein